MVNGVGVAALDCVGPVGPAPVAVTSASAAERVWMPVKHAARAVRGAVRVIGTFVPDLLEDASQGRPADLVNVSSIAAQYLYPNLAVYCATKAALGGDDSGLHYADATQSPRVAVIASCCTLPASSVKTSPARRSSRSWTSVGRAWTF